jgi:cytochrome c oxidase subunit 3
MTWTVVGGLAFLSCQAWEWTHMITAEHPVLTNGALDVIGQTVRVNPWGADVHGPVVTQALANTSHAELVKLAHIEHHDQSFAQLGAMTDTQLRGMINLDNMHVREMGPVAFGGYFYAITGFHGFHVLSGVVINIIMLIMAQRDVFEKRGHYLMIEKAGLYWHFVDLVWVFVFLCFYLV